MEKPQNHQLRNLVIILGFLCAVAVLNGVGQQKIERVRVCTNLQNTLETSAFSSIEGQLQAHAAFVEDFTTGKKIYGLNDAIPLPLASLTKLMTLRVALHRVSLASSYRVTTSDVTFDGPSGFVPGDMYSVNDLAKAALIASSNNAATMLAQSSGLSLPDFIASMNAEAALLGLSTLRYDSVTGLDADSGQATVFGSAHDVLTLMYRDVIDFPTAMAYSTEMGDTIKATNGRSIELANTDLAIEKLGLLRASKTGYTDVAGGNLAVMWQEPSGHMLGAAVLGSTQDARFSDVIALHDAANVYVSLIRSLPKQCLTPQ